MKSNILWMLGLSVALVVLATGCETTPTQQGALVGGALGAGAGAIIGNQTGHSGNGALIGAAAGALTGALVGDKIGEERRKAQAPVAAPVAAPPPATTSTGHYENRIVKKPSGETYEERVWVPDR